MNLELVKARLDVVFSTMMLNSLLVDDQHAKEINGYARQIDLARKELSCDSSANCSDTSGCRVDTTESSGGSSTTSSHDVTSASTSATSAPAAATPAKLSWLPVTRETLPPDGEYPIRMRMFKFTGAAASVVNGEWRCTYDLFDTAKQPWEYFPIHLV